MLDLRKRLVERRMIELDPGLAQHYLAFNAYETQRRLRPEHVKELSGKMKSGLFRFGEVAFARWGVNGGPMELMLNGQHVCEAVVTSGETIPCVLERFRIEDQRELSEAFRQFEILPRSLRDMVRVEAHSLKLTWPVWVASLVVAAGVMDRINTDRLCGSAGTGGENPGAKAFTREAKVRLLKEYLIEGEFLNDILTLYGTSRKRRAVLHLARQAVALMMMRTFRLAPEDARSFWTRVRDGEDLKRDMPEMKLREFLMAAPALDRRVSNHEYAARSATAWNAYRKKKATNLAYRANKPVPKLR